MVDKTDKQKYALNGYNDKPERDAFIKDMQTASELKDFIYDYFDLEIGKKYAIKSDPLGKYAVDLAVIDRETKTIKGLVEVDVFFSWK